MEGSGINACTRRHARYNHSNYFIALPSITLPRARNGQPAKDAASVCADSEPAPAPSSGRDTCSNKPSGSTKDANAAPAFKSASIVSKFLVRWRASMLLSMESLSERDHAIKTLPIGGPGDARQLTLLMSKSPSTGDEDPQEARVVFVHWLPLKRLVGKVVPVDSETGLISYVPNFVKTEETFKGDTAEIIHPAAGVYMRKSKDDREKVPAAVLRLKHMFEVSLTPRTGFEDWCECDCMACQIDMDVATLATETVARCALCLLDLHEVCAEALVKSLPSERAKKEKLLKATNKTKFNISMIPASIVVQEAENEPGAQKVKVMGCLQASLVQF